MDYRKLGSAYYIRMDRGDEMHAVIKSICEAEDITAATYTGIGGCGSAEIQTFDPEQGSFSTELLEGLLELVSFTGNIVADDAGTLHQHTHATFAFEDGGQHCMRAGHLKSATIRYTGEVELRPVPGKALGLRHDPETGTEFWDFKDER